MKIILFILKDTHSVYCNGQHWVIVHFNQHTAIFRLRVTIILIGTSSDYILIPSTAPCNLRGSQGESHLSVGLNRPHVAYCLCKHGAFTQQASYVLKLESRVFRRYARPTPKRAAKYRSACAISRVWILNEKHSLGKTHSVPLSVKKELLHGFAV